MQNYPGICEYLHMNAVKVWKARLHVVSHIDWSLCVLYVMINTDNVTTCEVTVIPAQLN